MENSMHKLIIFDCDGVLVDSEIIANRIDSQLLTELGYSISPEESIRRFTGVNSKDVRRIILEESGIELPNEYSRMVREKIVQTFEAGLSSISRFAREK